jgi:hypothetical protein
VQLAFNAAAEMPVFQFGRGTLGIIQKVKFRMIRPERQGF